MFNELNELSLEYNATILAPHCDIFLTLMGKPPVGVEIGEEQYYKFLKIVSTHVHLMYTKFKRNRTGIG